MRSTFRLLCLLSLGAFAARAEETMRIAIEEKVATLTLQAAGGRLWQAPPAEEPAWQEVPGGLARLTWKGGQLWLNAKPVEARNLLFGAGGQSTQAGGTPLRVGEKALRGQVEVSASPQGLTAVNILPLEDYLKGVLGKEMPKTFPMEALKAQAVAARTYALQKKLQRLGEELHLGATVLHQVYGGLAAEDERTREAVEKTRGQVLLFGMEAVEAYFHASCGGQTETGWEALTRDLPYLVARACPCHDTPAARWQVRVSEAELKKTFGTASGQLQPGPLTATGRYKSLKLGNQSIVAAEFRRRLGSTRVRSLKFRIEKEKGDYVLRGEGYGHGAGMCQWGAKRLAERGKSYVDILQHYYAGSRLLTLY